MKDEALKRQERTHRFHLQGSVKKRVGQSELGTRKRKLDPKL
jgi:hypothetical protein